jgi:hypothetical protein
MIIVDYTQVALAAVLMFQSDLKKGMSESSTKQAIDIIRHATLSSLKYYKKKYSHEYGDMVIACDGQNYWRKQVFPQYKAGRKASREKSDLDWKLIFDSISTLREDLKENFPYKVVHIEGAEADDVIGALVKWSQTNDLVAEGLYEEPQKILIVSSDGDFKQLQKYKNVRQWSPMQKKYVEVKDPQAYLMEHITKAGDDGIPNILSADNVFVDGIRQKPVMAKRLAKFIEIGREACENDQERRNWDRNRTLVDLDYIPEDITNSIIDSYTNQVVKGDKNSIMNYLIKNKCRLLLDEIEQF